MDFFSQMEPYALLPKKSSSFQLLKKIWHVSSDDFISMISVNPRIALSLDGNSKENLKIGVQNVPTISGFAKCFILHFKSL